jgi:predicted nucleic acid-binding protein
VKVFFDTSVLVASVIEGHSAHIQAFPALARVQSGADEGLVAAHTLAEAYAVLTTLPAPFRHSPEQALLSLEENVIRFFKISSLTGLEYASTIREAATAGVCGGTIYDAVLLRAARKANPGRIYTLNLKHFQAVAPASLVPLLSLP